MGYSCLSRSMELLHGGLNTIGAAPCCVVTLMQIYAPLSPRSYSQKLKLIDNTSVSITISNGFGFQCFGFAKLLVSKYMCWKFF